MAATTEQGDWEVQKLYTDTELERPAIRRDLEQGVAGESRDVGMDWAVEALNSWDREPAKVLELEAGTRLSPQSLKGLADVLSGLINQARGSGRPVPYLDVARAAIMRDRGRDELEGKAVDAEYHRRYRANLAEKAAADAEAGPQQ